MQALFAAIQFIISNPQLAGLFEQVIGDLLIGFGNQLKSQPGLLKQTVETFTK